MGILDDYLEELKRDYPKYHNRFRFIGDLSVLTPALREKIAYVETLNAQEPQVLNIALNYGGRAEMVHAFRRLAAEGKGADDITEEDIAHAVYTAECGDPDMIVRTGEICAFQTSCCGRRHMPSCTLPRNSVRISGPADVDECVREFYSVSAAGAVCDTIAICREVIHMLKRILTAAVALCLFVPVPVFSETWAFPILFALCALIGVFELLRCGDCTGIHWIAVPLSCLHLPHRWVSAMRWSTAAHRRGLSARSRWARSCFLSCTCSVWRCWIISVQTSHRSARCLPCSCTRQGALQGLSACTTCFRFSLPSWYLSARG